MDMGKAGFGYTHTLQNVTFNFSVTAYANHAENGHTQDKTNYNHGRHRLRDGGLIPSCAAAAIGGEGSGGGRSGDGERGGGGGQAGAGRPDALAASPAGPEDADVSDFGSERSIDLRASPPPPAAAPPLPYTPKLGTFLLLILCNWARVCGGGGGSRKGMGRRRWEGERTRLAQHYDIPRVGGDHGGTRLMGSNFCLAHDRPKSKIICQNPAGVR
jgi:hypothetical protein